MQREMQEETEGEGKREQEGGEAPCEWMRRQIRRTMVMKQNSGCWHEWGDEGREGEWGRNNDRDDSSRAEEERGRMNQTWDWSQLKGRLSGWNEFRGEDSYCTERQKRRVWDWRGKKFDLGQSDSHPWVPPEGGDCCRFAELPHQW